MFNTVVAGLEFVEFFPMVNKDPHTLYINCYSPNDYQAPQISGNGTYGVTYFAQQCKLPADGSKIAYAAAMTVDVFVAILILVARKKMLALNEEVMNRFTYERYEEESSVITRLCVLAARPNLSLARKIQLGLPCITNE